jgi:hypothetical protein
MQLRPLEAFLPNENNTIAKQEYTEATVLRQDAAVFT